jgi:hypothetical protein
MMLRKNLCLSQIECSFALKSAKINGYLFSVYLRFWILRIVDVFLIHIIPRQKISHEVFQVSLVGIQTIPS